MKGHAQVALLPSGKVPGFGNLAKLVDVLAHRLVLQEDLTQSIATTLRRLTGAKAAACVVEAEHLCVAVTDPARQNARFRTAAGAGSGPDIERLFREIEAASHPRR
jgi:GTP cyclohydrolase I